MSVQVCTYCHHSFWRYQLKGNGRDLLPRRYCSWKCFWARRRPTFRGTLVEDLPPADPNDIRDVLRLHLEKAHGTSDLTKWFESCQICERLNEAIVIAQRSMV